jgi:hypothetical protein
MHKSTLYVPLICLAFLVSCSPKISNITNYNFKAENGAPLYNELNYWAAHPLKKDMSDNVPKPLGKYDSTQKQVDVFFIHPTTLIDYADTRMNAPVDDIELNKKTDESTILYQASVFNESCNVYAPRYRQAHIKAFFTPAADVKLNFDLAYADVKNAFETYLRLYNNGKPIIIAAHSQGTLHASKLLKEFFEDKPLQNKLVCAYIIGLPVTQNYFSVLKPCGNSWQTGCFISWRTFKSGYEGTEYVIKEKQKAIVINPLTWTMDSLKAPAIKNKGGVLKNFNKIVPSVVNAQVHKNILWTSKPKFFGNIFLTQKNYHIADYNFFYVNIRENVKERIGVFWKR